MDAKFFPGNLILTMCYGLNVCLSKIHMLKPESTVQWYLEAGLLGGA